jgi:hypothetical protein
MAMVPLAATSLHGVLTTKLFYNPSAVKMQKISYTFIDISGYPLCSSRAFHMQFPHPLWEGARGRGRRRQQKYRLFHPHPAPPPSRGREYLRNDAPYWS